MPPQPPTQPDLLAANTLLLHELSTVLPALNPGELQVAAQELLTAHRIFLLGAGRSGLALRMVAMRLMHLGLAAFVVGETTTPAITAGDLLLAASASGTTSTIVHAAEVAHKAGARILTLTTAPTSPLAKLSSTVVLLPAASKADTGERRSEQYAGSLFEQAVLLTGDALFHALWQAGLPEPQTSEQLLKRHSNLE